MSIPIYFALAMVVGFPVDLLFNGTSDFEQSVLRALYFAIAMPIGSLLLKLRVAEMAKE